MCIKKHALVQKNDPKRVKHGFAMMSLSQRDNSWNALDMHWYFVNAKIPGTAVSKEGHAGPIIIDFLEKGATVKRAFCQLFRQNSLYLLNDPWTRASQKFCNILVTWDRIRQLQMLLLRS